MAAPTEAAVKRNAILTLVKDPTNLAGTAPTYGGTELGPIRGWRLTPVEPVTPIGDQAKGSRPYAGIRGARWAIFSVVLRGFDPAAISAIFPDSPGNGDIAASDAGSPSYPPGTLANSFKILAVPNVSGDAAIYMPNAMPVVAREPINFENRNEVPISLAFYALPDATGRCYYVAPISRLTL